MDRIRSQILRALKAGDRTFWGLVNEQDGHLVKFYEVIQKLLREKLIKYEGGKFSLLKDPMVRERVPTLCSICDTGIEIKGYFKEICERFLEITRERPLPIKEYDQGFIRPIDTIRRVAFIYERGDIEGTRTFILGDDDLLSIAIGLTRMAEMITVVEIDERIIRFIEKFKEREDICNIQVRRYNVVENLPQELEQKYDVFITDPVETSKGFKLFVGRCIRTLKGKGSAGYIGLTHREASLEKWAEFQRFFLDAGFVVTDIIRNLATYPERENRFEEFYESYEIMTKMELPIPQVDWYKSSFVRIEAIKRPHVELPHLKDLDELYFDDESWATPGFKEG